MQTQPHSDVSRGPGAVRALEDALDPIVALMGFELILVEVSGNGRHTVVRIYLDKPPSGPTIDDCARMSRVVENAIDAEIEPHVEAVRRLLSGGYTLEVSSPGIDRPLVRIGHFRHVVGQTVRVTTFDPLLPESRQRNFQGRLLAVDIDPGAPEDTRRGLVTVLDEATPTEWQIPLAGIRKANLIADPFPRENKR